MNENKQNACLMVTSHDNDTGKDILSYIPLSLDLELLTLLCQNGSNCENNTVVNYEIDKPIDKFWADVWEELV